MHSDDPAGVPPENEQQPEPIGQSSTASQNASPASHEPERARQGPTPLGSAPPSSARPGLAAIFMEINRQKARDRWVDREMRREEIERKRANDIRLQLERRRTQLSDAIEDTGYWLTLKLTTKEQSNVNQMFTLLWLWHRGINELLLGLPFSDTHPHWLEYPGIFLYFYKKTSEARGERVGEHLGQLADGLSSEFREATKAAVETWIASRKAGRKPGAMEQKQADVPTSTASRKKKHKHKPKPVGPRVEEPASASPAKSAVVKAATEPEPEETTKDLQPFIHVEDYRSIVYYGETFTLPLRPAAMMKLLHEAHVSGKTPYVSKDKLLAAAESETGRVSDFFRGPLKPLWGKLIKGKRSGNYYLDLPLIKPRPN